MGRTEQFARRRASTSSVAENASGSGDETDRTPIASPSDTSGSTTIDAIANPCPAATRKRGSFVTSTTRAGLPCASTQPASPSPTFNGGPPSSRPVPARALARSSVRDASRSRIDGRDVAVDCERRVGHGAQRVLEPAPVGELLGEP